MENTYWNECGKYEEENAQIEKLVPRMGKTGNKYLDLYITASKLYYDSYNNGSCNFDNNLDNIDEYIRPFAKEINSRGAINFDVKDSTLRSYLNNESKLEKFMDNVITFVKDKDLSYDKYTVYYKDNNNFSGVLSKTEKEGFIPVTFGNKELYNNWINHRMNEWNYIME